MALPGGLARVSLSLLFPFLLHFSLSLISPSLVPWAFTPETEGCMDLISFIFSFSYCVCSSLISSHRPSASKMYTIITPNHFHFFFLLSLIIWFIPSFLSFLLPSCLSSSLPAFSIILWPFLNTKYADYGLAYLEVRTRKYGLGSTDLASPYLKYRLPRTRVRTCNWNCSGLDDSMSLFTVLLRPHA